jgi:histidinol phosphatase-like enzyme
MSEELKYYKDTLQTTKETLQMLMGGRRLLLAALIQESDLTVDSKSKIEIEKEIAELLHDIEALEWAIVLVSIRMMELTQYDIAPEFQEIEEKWNKITQDRDQERKNLLLTPEEKADIRKFLGLK